MGSLRPTLRDLRRAAPAGVRVTYDQAAVEYEAFAPAGHRFVATGTAAIVREAAPFAGARPPAEWTRDAREALLDDLRLGIEEIPVLWQCKAERCPARIIWDDVNSRDEWEGLRDAAAAHGYEIDEPVEYERDPDIYKGLGLDFCPLCSETPEGGD